MQRRSGTRQRAAVLLAAVLLFLATSNAVLIAQNLGAAPQTNVAVQGQTGARWSQTHHYQELMQYLPRRLVAVSAHPSPERIADINPGVDAMDDCPVAGLADCPRYMIRANDSRNIQRQDGGMGECLYDPPRPA